MQISQKKLAKSELELTIELSPDEMKPYLERGANRLTTEKPIEGFRPGKAPLEVVMKKFGDMPVMEAAAEEAVRGTFPKALAQEQVLSMGSPSIGVKKMAPGNPFIYTATVSVLPEVTLCDLTTIKVAAKKVAVAEEDVARAIKDLRAMRATETAVARTATGHDKVTIDMDMKQNGVPIEGGQTRGHHVFLDEPYYIPGLADALLGLKKGDTKSFTLTFPKEHYQKNVAGKPVDFSVTVREVYERTLPEANDSFAASLGQKTMQDLDALLRKNLLEDAENKENQRQEIAMLEEIVRCSRFGDLPDLLVNEEVGRMIAELRDGITRRGMDWAQYLAEAKKSENQLKLDFVPQAIQRIRVALVVRAVAVSKGIEAEDHEVSAEVEREMSLYADDPDTQARIRAEDYADRVRVVLRNRKVVEFLKKTIVS